MVSRHVTLRPNVVANMAMHASHVQRQTEITAQILQVSQDSMLRTACQVQRLTCDNQSGTCRHQEEVRVQVDGMGLQQNSESQGRGEGVSTDIVDGV